MSSLPSAPDEPGARGPRGGDFEIDGDDVAAYATVTDAIFSTAATKTAWLLGFLTGAALAEGGVDGGGPLERGRAGRGG